MAHDDAGFKASVPGAKKFEVPVVASTDMGRTLSLQQVELASAPRIGG